MGLFGVAPNVATAVTVAAAVTADIAAAIAAVVVIFVAVSNSVIVAVSEMTQTFFKLIYREIKRNFNIMDHVHICECFFLLCYFMLS